ncbi:MAG TPA: nitroreductase [Rhodocyclaceae bacterium]|nr:nitroreductase [Rhodocyclaceae bacterium]
MKFFWQDEELSPVEIVDRAIEGRKSVRAFLPTPLPAGELERILEVAAQAASGGNMQPWRVYVLEGEARQRLVNAVCYAYDFAPEERKSEYEYYPPEFFEPYAARRRKLGWDLYGLLGIERGEKGKMKAQQRRNFEFFGAPTGLIFTIDRRFTQGGWLDYGGFLQNIMIAARVRGIDSCAQASWMEYPGVVERELEIPRHEMVVCGMALGYADPDAVENKLVSERIAVADFTIRPEK